MRLSHASASSCVISAAVASILCVADPAASVLASDDVASGQWYASAMRLGEAHQITNGAGVVVALVDSGVDSTHPVLQGSILPGADFSDSDETSSGDGRVDLDGHGTGMASLIVGHGRIAGVAPAAKILPVRVAGNAQRTNFAQGIHWAISHGANVINISRGSPLADPREKAAIDEAIRRDIVVVASAGNPPQAVAVQYPASYPGVVAVAATAKDGSHSLHSVTGPQVLLAAPGEDISVADLNHGYALATGTSDSAALVSGVAALIRSRFPDLSADEVTRMLTDTAVDVGSVGRDESFGFGMVSPVDALKAHPPVRNDNGSGPATKRSFSAQSSNAHAMASRSVLLYGSLFLLFIMLVAGVAVATLAIVKSKT